MGAALVMAVTLALVLALVFILLAELYCSLLLRTRGNRRKCDSLSTTPSAAAVDPPELTTQQPYIPSLCSFYYQGVLPAPRGFLFPAPVFHHDLEKQPTSPMSTISAPVGQPYYSPSSATTSTSEHPMYICNPIYDVHEAMIGLNPKAEDTPFETPGTSPSRLESAADDCSDSATPPLTPMRKLPAEGPSVSLRDARSICTTGSDSNNSINYVISVSSSSSSDSQKTSPSW